MNNFSLQSDLCATVCPCAPVPVAEADTLPASSVPERE